MKNLKNIVLIIFLLFSCAMAKTQQEEYKNDVLYSQEYFDYLIECASIADFEMKEEARLKASKTTDTETQSALHGNEVTLGAETELFKLRAESTDIGKFRETVKKENSKTTIQINDKFNVVQDTVKSRNKYNSNDYRLKAGVEYAPVNKAVLSGGIETNFRGLDQNPASKKLYFSPTVKLGEKLSVSLINKINTTSKAVDYDISLNFSPFKSKVTDFNIYAGYTKGNNGSSSESINFMTNFYFF